MIRGRVTAAWIAVATIGVWATPVQAQESRRDGGVEWVIGTEFWADQRGAHVVDYDEDYPAGFSAPTPPHDEAWANHSVDYRARHSGVFATIGFKTGGATEFRGVLGAGVVTSGLVQHIEADSLMWQLTIGAPTYGARTYLDNDSEPGFGAILAFDMTHHFDKTWWVRTEFRSHQGLTSLPDQVMFGNNLRGGSRNSYSYWLGALSGVVGFEMSDGTIAPYAGLDLSYYYGVYETEQRPVGTLLGLPDQTVTMGNWSYVRFLLGVEVGSGPVRTQLQLSIWNPTRDLGFALTASLAI
jgi:hypothetical protein